MSSLDPHTTFLDLVGTENLAGDLKDSVSGLGVGQVELQHPPRGLRRGPPLRLRRPLGETSPS